MKLTNKQISALWTVFAVLATTLIAANAALFFFTDAPSTPTGSATAQVGACINFPPYWLNAPTCDDAFTNNAYTCNVSASDDDHNISHYNATLLEGPAQGASLFENISSDGIIRFNASFNQSGNYSVEITATDNHTCALSNSAVVNISVVASNESPIFEGPLPNSTWDENTILVPYDLDDYFTDPEGFALAYRAVGNNQIKITINNGEVTLQPASDYCGTEIVHFVATDVTNLSARSNDVELTVECVEENTVAPGDADSGGGGGGGGGGAGGGSNNPNACSEEYYCYDWSDCQYTKAVSLENARTINITGVRGTREYTLDEPLREGEEVFYEGYQWRECLDTRMCNERTLTYARSCEYTPNCNDGIQNQDETGVDCGGVCGPCHTCEDGIHNGQEEDVDCGGPDCEPCHTCSDGKINGLETGVDCGGPDCPECATCFDGIQNGLETGVDCGGPDCQECPQEQEPSVVGTALTTILLIGLGVLLLLVAALVFARKYVMKLLAAYALRYQKTNRVVLLGEQDKREVLAELAQLREELGSLEPVEVQQRLAKTVRGYFMRALGLEFEFDKDDLQAALEPVQESLSALLSAYFARVQSVEFSQDPIHSPLVSALMHEQRQLVYQTSVLSVEELREFEKPLTLADEEGQEGLEALYTVLSNARLAVESGRAVLGRDLYGQAHTLYESLDEDARAVAYPELHRLYLALQVEDYKQQSLLFLGNRNK